LGSEIPYYRTLLKLLFLALRIHTTTSEDNLRASVLAQSATSLVPTLLDILRNVVANGIRELASSLHSAPSSETEPTHLPEDLALLTGILQTILQIPAIELHPSSLVNIFSNASTTRVATTLFSWSDTLAQSGDPIYGELSILFLLELSAIPSMAEQMAIDGVLGQIAAANITSYLRRGINVGPFVESAGGQRCYSIWVRGILPFLLNLLDGVQLPIAGEISLFLDQFQPLLAQSVQAFDAPETNRLLAKGQAKFVSLSSCSEVHSLALITHILHGFKQQAGGEAIVEVEWDASGLSENVEWWLGSRTLLRDRIVPVGEREVGWSRRKGQDGEKSLLEEKVIAELLGVRDVFSASG
jgi:nuclear pore complex protein Nup188